MLALGDRMKGYEAAGELVLPRRIPVIARLDGNSFSKFTKQRGFKKPFDHRFEDAMLYATERVLEYISGVQFAYVQSDEINILMLNDQKPQTEPFLANRTQKLASLLASTVSVAFNNHLGGTDAAFDCRVFVVPKEDVNNLFLWRQRDCFKNCISSVAYWGLREKYGRKTAQKMLHGKSDNERQEIIFQELGINVNDIPVTRKRGMFVRSVSTEMYLREVMGKELFEEKLSQGHVEEYQKVVRSHWAVDENVPIFSEDPDYINSYMEGAYE